MAGLGENIPAGTIKQASVELLPAEGLYLPAAHGMQALAPIVDCV